MTFLKKVVLIVLILCSCVGCDQTTKAVAKEHLAPAQSVSLMNDLIRFHYSENTGSLLSLGAELPSQTRFWILTVGVGAVLIGLLGFALTNKKLHPVGVIAIALVIGGGFSNLLDRLFNDGVVFDFMNIGVGNLRTGIFNVADVAIMAGAGLLALWSAGLKSPQESQNR